MSKPTPGVYRLTPALKFHRPAYDVAVTSQTCGYPAWGTPGTYSPTHDDFRWTGGGWTFGWKCFGDGTYLHFAIDLSNGHLVDLDMGTCEEV